MGCSCSSEEDGKYLEQLPWVGPQGRAGAERRPTERLGRGLCAQQVWPQGQEERLGQGSVVDLVLAYTSPEKVSAQRDVEVNKGKGWGQRVLGNNSS